MHILVNIAASLVLFLGAVWALLPGSFGLLNFKKMHGKYWGWLAALVWGILILSHPVSAYKIWFSPENAYEWLLVPLALQIFFFTIFGRNVSTQ